MLLNRTGSRWVLAPRQGRLRGRDRRRGVQTGRSVSPGSFRRRDFRANCLTGRLGRP